MVGAGGLEPPTSTLKASCSASELYPQTRIKLKIGGEYRIRTYAPITERQFSKLLP